MFKKQTIKPPKEFILLYNETEKLHEEIFEILSQNTGYNKQWVKKNPIKCLQSVNVEIKKQVEKKFLHLQVMKQYLWSKYYFENFEEVFKYISPPSRVQYNHKTKLIELIDGNTMQEQVKKTIKDFREKLEKISNSFKNLTLPPQSLGS